MFKPIATARAAIRSMTDAPAVRILLAIAAILPSVPAFAQRYEEDRHWHGDIAHFHEHDWGMWRSGRWVNGEHDKRRGWWWVAGGQWYFYPAPVYPYPDPYQPPVATTPAPTTVPPAPIARTWYYCEAANGYYPYVSSCPGRWKEVAANPAPSAQSAPPQ